MPLKFSSKILNLNLSDTFHGEVFLDWIHISVTRFYLELTNHLSISFCWFSLLNSMLLSQQATFGLIKIDSHQNIWMTYHGNCILAEEDLQSGLPEWHNPWLSLSVWWRWLSLPTQDHHNSSHQGWVMLVFIYLPKASSFD